MTTTFEEANAALRQAVGTRIAAAAAGKPAEQWYDPQDEDSPRPFAGDSLFVRRTCIRHRSGSTISATP